jgi:hypothetical protein
LVCCLTIVSGFDVGCVLEPTGNTLVHICMVPQAVLFAVFALASEAADRLLLLLAACIHPTAMWSIIYCCAGQLRDVPQLVPADSHGCCCALCILPVVSRQPRDVPGLVPADAEGGADGVQGPGLLCRHEQRACQAHRGAAAFYTICGCQWLSCSAHAYDDGSCFCCGMHQTGCMQYRAAVDYVWFFVLVCASASLH